MLQETRVRGVQQQSWKTKAEVKGWKGLWRQADKGNANTNTGGLAILAREAPVLPGGDNTGNRWMRGQVHWTKTKSLQLIQVYGRDSTADEATKVHEEMLEELQEEVGKFRGNPWITAGDWNMEPEAVSSR